MLDASLEGDEDPILGQLEEILAGRVTSPLSPEEWAECIAEEPTVGFGSFMPEAEPQTSLVKFSDVEIALPGLEAAKLLRS